MRTQHDPAMDNLRDAIDWLQAHWDEQRQAPIRLHTAHSTEGALGAPAFSAAFAGALDWTPSTIQRRLMTVSCGHPMNRGEGRDCPECAGANVKDVASDRYPYPMTSALLRLALSPRHRTLPHPVLVVHEIAARDWNAREVAAHYGMGWATAEAWFLRAIRKLHGWYSAGPVNYKWTDLSESQQQAVLAA